MKKVTRKDIFYIILIIFSIIITCETTLLMCKCSYKRKNNYYDENILKVVEIAGYDEIENKSFGSGWFLDESTIVTNYHVISYLIDGQRECFDNIDIRFYDQQEYEEVKILKINDEKDIALLQYKGTHKHLFFSTQNFIYNSEKCYSIGNFSNYGLSYKEGYISLTAIKLLYNSNYSLFIQCSISIGQGDSGAPLFNENNEIIGMITFRTKGLTGNVEQGFAYAIPINYILEEI